MSATPTKTGEFTGRHMLLLAFAFFGVIIAVNVFMAVLSSTSWTGLVVENSYVASQEFETKRLAHEAQQAAGWQTDFRHDGGVAMLSVLDAAGKHVDLGTVNLLVNRPVGGHDDQKLVLARQPDGTYSAPLALESGVWDAHVDAPQTEKGSFELHERFSVAGN